MEYYVYFHVNRITNEVFYVGKGKNKRAYSKRNRSTHWKNTVNKYGYIVEIKNSNLTNEEACNLEKEYIKKFGRKDNNTGCLVNFTDGGEGSPNRPMNSKTKELLKISNTGRPTSKLQKEIVGNRYKGKFGAEHNRSKSILCITTNTTYGSISEASRELNIPISSIHWSLKNNKILKKLHFQYGLPV